MSNVIDYIKSISTVFPNYETTTDITTKDDEKAAWITKVLLRKNFRKTKIYEQNKQDITKKALISIKEDIPMHFVILFGGYKHFWNESYPEVDWAELFNLNFMSELLAPILQVHKPGIVLDYASEDLIITMMDNYPRSSLDRYADSFGKLIEFYTRCCPPNFKINYVRTGEKYDFEKLKSIVKEKLPQKINDFNKLTQEERERHLHRSPRSIMWKGEEDWTQLDEKEREIKIMKSKITEDTFYEVEAGFLGDYFTGYNRITIVLSWGLTEENVDHWLTVGSTHASTVDFWIGRGMLEERDDRYIPRVVSHKQYDEIKPRLKRVEIGLVPLKNLEEIEVYEGELSFG